MFKIHKLLVEIKCRLEMIVYILVYQFQNLSFVLFSVECNSFKMFIFTVVKLMVFILININRSRDCVIIFF